MTRLPKPSRRTVAIFAFGLGGMASSTTAAPVEATAAPTPATAAPADRYIMEEVVVTGTYIRGTPEDTALPVSVFDREELAEQGSPNFVELVQRMPAVNGFNIGESNRFLGGTSQGTATFNLRGLGHTRTLVLMNGQRMPTVNSNGLDYVDINQVPMAALARVEVLRDGGAAIYGSDALAGVVNFITRRDLDGFEFKGSFKAIDDSDGQYDGSVAYGWTGERSNVIFAGSYARKTEVRATDFDFMLPENGVDGFSSFGNPGSYRVLNAVVDADRDGAFERVIPGRAFLDLGCVELGGTALGIAAAPACSYPFVLTDSPVNDEKHWNLFAEANYEFTDSIRLHTEFNWARNHVPNYRDSVSLVPVLSPTPIETSGASTGGGTSPVPALAGTAFSRYYIPRNHPGLLALMTPCPYDASTCANALTNGVITQSWRPRALGGSPSFGGDTEQFATETTTLRFSLGLEGEFDNGWGWNTDVTYGRGERGFELADLSVNRVQLGLRGLGGPGCDPSTGTPGVTPCQWFNAFASSITRSIVNGRSYSEATGRPQGLDVSEDLWNWMRVPLKTGHTADLVSVQAMISGDLGSFSLPGGELSWVLGSQWRYSDRRTKSNDAFDPAITPCPDSPPFGDGVPTCPVDVGAFIFNNPQGETQFDRDVLAFFAEVQVPIFDSLELGLAARFEDYGGTFGSNISPRASLRWQALSWLAFRGTAGSTFRAPPDSLSTPGTQRSQGLLTNPVTGVQAPRAIDLRTGVLDPEEANTYNVGFIVASDEIEVSGRNIGTFNLSVDYYIIDFTNEFQGESALAVYNAMFRGSNNPANWSCDVDALRERFNFRPADSADSTNNQSYAGRTFQSCHPSNLEGMTVERFNGDATDIKGLDIAASWRLTEVFGGELEIGVDASYMMQFKRSAVKLSGTSFVTEPAIDRADTAELLGAFFSYPEWRRTAYVKYAMGEHVVRWDTRYYSGTKDLNAGGTRRDSHMLHDITYRWRLPKYNLILTGTVGNLLDEEPPYIRSQFNYDYSTYSPLGRTFKLGVEYSLK